MSRSVKLHGRPSLWMVVADYSAVEPAIKPLLESGKIKEVVHGNSAAHFETAFQALTVQCKNALKECGETAGYPQVILAMNSAQAPKVLKLFLENDTWRKSLVWVHSLFVGVDAFKLQAFDQSIFEGVNISNAYNVFSHILAEHVMFASLYFLRRTTRLQKNQEKRIWSPTLNPVMRDLKMGVLGYGEIGACCAAMAKRGFLVREVQGWRRSGTGEVDDHGVKVVGGTEGFEDTIATSDIILNVLPNTRETHHMIEKVAFAKMKKNVIFISIGRGSTVCEADLADALNDDLIGGAALDVFENEPLATESPLYDVKDMSSKLLLTPHDADHGLNRYFPAAEQFATYIDAFITSGGSLAHIHRWVDPARGY